ncbi:MULTISPECIES: winged helix-turn-helix domain-containing protein [Pseudoalteromonas]|uniref:winged helix-turn-helix domain-containing protein n=1 Tax=Pseudoalteromonas TaxID=53246 RepID=UPI00037ED6D9|nr:MULTISPECIES: winged helix-turn-helix domain-containing protein [Pseudoalteromonas]
MTGFRIGNFDVDVSRCKISSAESEQVVEPKVMDVLQFLYSQRGKVVSQEDIFAAVWPNAVFSPSNVQRNIALLRKALKEDSKSPQFIITHPKRGYCLELDKEESSQGVKWPIFVFIAVTVICIAGGWFSFSKQIIKTDFSVLVPVTSNEENESYQSQSQSGDYLAFVRGDDNKQHIWLKEFKTGKEVKLTRNPSTYTSLGWSPDDRALAFIETYNDAVQLAYFNLDMLNLTTLSYSKILEFKEYLVTSQQLQWANNNQIYFIERQKNNNETQLSLANIETKRKKVIKASVGQDWLKLHALSPDQTQLALGYEAGQNNYRIDILNLSDNSSKAIAIVENGIQGLSWHPSGEYLLISNTNKLVLIDRQGNSTDIAFNNYQIIRDASYTPSGEEILMELVNIDVDILRSTNTTPQQYEKLIDTSSVDFLPVFSPDSSKFVFESHRFGLKQLFLYEQGKQTLIFANPNNEELFGVVWSKNGEEVITASKDKLFRIDLNSGDYQEIPHPHHSFYLREKFNNEDAILVSYRSEDGVTFHPAKLDMQTLSLTPFTGQGERLACYAMALDKYDRVYFSNNKQVFRLAHDNSFEQLWQADDNDIIGLAVDDQTLNITSEQHDGYLLTMLNLHSARSEVRHIVNEKGNMLINASHDSTQFLYLTKPKRTRTLVRLR